MTSSHSAHAGSGASREIAGSRPKPLRILVLGGTQFIGIHMVDVALERGHTVTLFNRGRSNPEMLPGVEKLKGDRNGDLEALKGRNWDAVIDNSGYVPRHVRLSAERLAPQVGRYLFISTISVYASFAAPNDEDSPLRALADDSIEKVDGLTYGPLKALCERAVHAACGNRATIVRPGFIVGPHDSTDRFTHWPARAAHGGEMIAPGSPADPMQFVDARDLARFTIDMLERDVTETFNVTSPPGHLTIGQVIEESVAAANALAHPQRAPQPVWIPTEFLEQQQGATMMADFPIWLPAKGELAAFAEINVTRALKAGLKLRPLDGTVHDTLQWHLARPTAERASLKAGISADREREVLAAWRKSHQ
ncbi:MAG: NAD-dependent epimerase/dehydratase family protein [Steroidobacteraceae bacterium]